MKVSLGKLLIESLALKKAGQEGCCSIDIQCPELSSLPKEGGHVMLFTLFISDHMAGSPHFIE